MAISLARLNDFTNDSFHCTYLRTTAMILGSSRNTSTQCYHIQLSVNAS